MSSTRIYLVTDKDSDTKRLVRAGSQAQAVRHAARTQFMVEVAGQDDLVAMVANGHPVEDASSDAVTSHDLADQVIEHVASLLDQPGHVAEEFAGE